jgi:septum site-determining protein MinD
MAKTIGVLSLKGGVGKTSSVIALGDAIADFGKKVLLVDGNFSSPTLGLSLNILNPEKTMHDVINRTSEIEEAIQKYDKFDVLPADLFNKLELSPMSLKNKLRPLAKDYDYILIDSSPALNEETLGAMLASDKLLVVTTPDLPTLSMTIKAVKTARKRGAPIAGLIVNKIYNKDFEIPLKDIEGILDVPVLAAIPHDINILKAVSKFKPFTSFKPKSKASIEFKKLAGALIGEKFEPKKWTDFLFKWKQPSLPSVNREIYYNSVF